MPNSGSAPVVDATSASAPTSTSGSTSAPAPASPSTPPPTVHVRAIATWLAIFPMVALGMMALAPISQDWHPVLRALVLTAVVVPLAVYLVVPQFLRAYGVIRRR